MNNSVLQITSPLAAAVVSVEVKLGDQVFKAQPLANLESMKMQTLVTAPENAVITAVLVASGDTIQAGQLLFEIEAGSATSESTEQVVAEPLDSGTLLDDLQAQLATSISEFREGLTSTALTISKFLIFGLVLNWVTKNINNSTDGIVVTKIRIFFVSLKLNILNMF